MWTVGHMQVSGKQEAYELHPGDLAAKAATPDTLQNGCAHSRWKSI